MTTQSLELLSRIAKRKTRYHVLGIVNIRQDTRHLKVWKHGWSCDLVQRRAKPSCEWRLLWTWRGSLQAFSQYYLGRGMKVGTCIRIWIGHRCVCGWTVRRNGFHSSSADRKVNEVIRTTGSFLSVNVFPYGCFHGAWPFFGL